MGAALVLNATYEPLCVVPLRRAVVLVLAEKAVVVEAGDTVMHSERLALPAPSVVRLSRYVRVPYRREVPLTRRAVLDRHVVEEHLAFAFRRHVGHGVARPPDEHAQPQRLVGAQRRLRELLRA